MSQGEFGDFGQGEGTLTKAASMVAEAKVDFDRIASTMEGQISGARSQWGGQGATAFFSLAQAWDEKQRVIVSALNEFESSLQTTEKGNLAADESESSTFGSLTSRLGDTPLA